MSRRSSRPASRPPENPDPRKEPPGADELDEARGGDPAAKPLMPHERDETPEPVRRTPSGEAPVGRDRLFREAHEDLAEGQEDTDCRVDHTEDSSCPPRPDVAKPKKG